MADKYETFLCQCGGVLMTYRRAGYPGGWVWECDTCKRPYKREFFARALGGAPRSNGHTATRWVREDSAS